MESLTITKRKDTPTVNFDPENNIFEISGKCHPENIRIFFRPIMDWLDTFFENIKNTQNNKIDLILNFEYLNTASYKYLIEVMRKFYKFHSNNIPVEITWLYDEEDDDMKDSGVELFEMSDVKLPYKLKSFIDNN